MLRVVLDVNVLVSGFPASRGTPASILLAWSDGHFDLVISEHVMAGAVRAWGNSYYRHRYSQQEVQETLLMLRSQAIVVQPVATVHGVADDEEDDLVIATAVSGNADYLVTGDQGLRSVGSYSGITIYTPREFLDVLEERS